MDELTLFDWQIMWLAKASLAPHSDLSKFVEIVCAQNHPRKFYELLLDFYTAREAYVALPMLIQRLAQFNNDERFEL